MDINRLKQKVIQRPTHILLLILMLISIAYFGFGQYHFRTDKRKFSGPIILVTFESTPADHLSCYGYKRNTTPNICQLAQEGVLYKKFIAQSSWTLPALASLHTSLYPSETGVHEGQNLSENVKTLAEYLQGEGYQTHAIVEAPFVHPHYNLDQGFDSYFYREGYDNDEEVARATNLLANLSSQKERDFFLWIHFYQPHQGYNAPSPFSRLWTSNLSSPVSADQIAQEFFRQNLSQRDLKYIRAKYDQLLRYADHWFGKLVQQLQANKFYQDSLLIVTADHGEDLGQHGVIGHGYHFYENVIHIPLIIKWPHQRSAGKVVEHLVGPIDILPTTLDLMGKEGPQVRGISLLNKTGVARRKYLLSQGYQEVALRGHRWKYIWHSQQARNRDQLTKSVIRANEELYDLSQDPEEDKNLINKKEKKANQLKQRLAEFEMLLNQSSPANTGSEKVPRKLRERLKELGYLK